MLALDNNRRTTESVAEGGRWIDRGAIPLGNLFRGGQAANRRLRVGSLEADHGQRPNGEFVGDSGKVRDLGMIASGGAERRVLFFNQHQDARVIPIFDGSPNVSLNFR